jgi:hypothetical protein
MARDKDTCKNFIVWYKDKFGFTANAATALYDVQMLKTCSTLSKLDNDAVVVICKAISKVTNQSVAKVAATRLKLVCFWIKHQYRTSREIGMTLEALVRVKFEGTINLLRQQKRDKDNRTSENKEPKYTPLTLDTASATKVFDKVKNLLARVRGVAGVPLVYVIRILIIPEDRYDDPPFGDETPSIRPLTWRQRPALLSFQMMPITRESTRPLMPMDRLFPPSSLTPRRFGPFSLHVLASQARGNTSRSLLLTRMGGKPGAPSTIISLGGQD